VDVTPEATALEVMDGGRGQLMQVIAAEVDQAMVAPAEAMEAPAEDMEAQALDGTAAVGQAMVAPAEAMEAQTEVTEDLEVVSSLTLCRQVVMEAVLEAGMAVPAEDMGVQAAAMGVQAAAMGVQAADGAVPGAADTMARLSP